MLLGGAAAASAQSLAWNANAESNLAGYRIQYGTSSSALNTTVSLGKVTSWALPSSLQAGVTYYFRVVAYNTAGQVSAPSAQVSYTKPSTPPPSSSLTVSGVSPASGPKAGGTTITVTGSGFVSGARVSIGTLVASNVVFVSSTQLRATTPYSSTTGARDVRVTNPKEQYAIRAGGFTYTTSTSPTPPPPSSSLTVSGVSPASGPRAGGTTITVTGSGFVSGARVSIGTLVASNVTFVSSTQLRARTPYSSTTGARDVRVINPGEQYAIRAGGFTYVNTAASSTALTADSPGTFTSYLAEGVQTDQMNTQLAIANAEPTDAQVNLTFMDAAGATSSLAVDVPARSRQTVDLRTQPQLAGQTFSTRVDASQPVAVDRLVSLDAEGQAASLESAVSDASPRWYFADGSTRDPMELFYLVQNPGSAPAHVRVRYLLPGGQASVTKTYEVAAGSRATIWVDREDPALAATDVAAEITSVEGAPIVVERSLYVKQPDAAQPRAGDTSAGLTAPATQWFVQASTGAGTTRLLLANPGSAPAKVRATYQREDGRRVVRGYTVAAGSRLSIDVAEQDASLADATLGITVESTQPIVVERSTWRGAEGALDEAVSAAGATHGGARWLLAEAEQGGARQAGTDVVLFNHGSATEVTVTLLFEGAPERAATFQVAAGTRFTVPMAEAFPEATGRFSVLVEAADPAANLTVDRAITWDGPARTTAAEGAAKPLR